MQGLLWAEGMRKDGMKTWQLKGLAWMEGEVGDFWKGFDDYIGYCEERGSLDGEGICCPLDKQVTL